MKTIESGKCFILHLDQWPALNCYSDEQLGRLLRHICRWILDDSGDVRKEGLLVENDIMPMYLILQNQAAIDDKKYQQKCEKNKQNARRRWSKNDSDATVCERMQNNNNNNNNNNKNNNNNNNNNKINKESLVDLGRRDSSSSPEIRDSANVAEEEEEDNFSKLMKENFLPWWNQLVKDYDSNIKPMIYMTKNRIELARKICDTYGKDDLFKACRKAFASPFLNGRGKNAKFIATFDWMMDEKNFLNVLEGNFYTK